MRRSVRLRRRVAQNSQQFYCRSRCRQSIAKRMNKEKSRPSRDSKPGGDRPLRRRSNDAPAAKRAGEKDRSTPGSKRQDGGVDKRAKPGFEKKAAAKPGFEKKAPAKPGFEKKAPAKPRRQDAAKAPPAPQEKAHVGERVAKVMARAGACSRRDAEQWIAEGRVAVNGRTLTSPAFNVRESDAITVDGKPLAERERTRLFLFHKPAGLVTSAKDPEGRATVFDFIAERHPDLPRLVSIGRLDINTEGLLLLSNDGSLARVLELPATGWTRRYRVRAHGEVDQAMLDELAKGVTVDDISYAPIEARLDRLQGANAWITMSLSEGKNREIKRVLEHLRVDVTRLIRVSFGPFQLGDLAEGAIEEVRLKTLREQLGKGLAELARVDFSSPLREAPSATEQQEARVAAQKRPRKHVSAMRRQSAERTDATAPRARIERAVTADRKGRAVAVERVVVKKAAGVAESRNARRFEALRRSSEAADAAPSRPAPARRERQAAAFKRESEKRFERPRKAPAESGFGSPSAARRDQGPRGEDRGRRDREAPAFTREGGARVDRPRKSRFDRDFGSPAQDKGPRSEDRGRRDREAPAFKRDGGAKADRARKPGFDRGFRSRHDAQEGTPHETERRRQGFSPPREGSKTFDGPRKPRAEGASPSRFKREGGKRPEGPRKPQGEHRAGPRREGRPATHASKTSPSGRDAAKGPRGPGGKGKPPSRPRGGSQ
jgi:23S rRNA pseudouridine2605 synthase